MELKRRLEIYDNTIWYRRSTMSNEIAKIMQVKEKKRLDHIKRNIIDNVKLNSLADIDSTIDYINYYRDQLVNYKREYGFIESI